MIELLLIVAGLALADSINPSTLTVAAVYSVGAHARQRLVAFTAGVFGVSLAFGLVVVLGPGQLLLDKIPRPSPHAQHLIELGIGTVAVLGAVLVWVFRERVAAATAVSRPARGSATLVGAGIMLAELPTAFPYFAVLAAIITSGRHTWVQLLLLVLFNLVFVGPLLLGIGALFVFGARAEPYLVRFDRFLRRNAVRFTIGFLAILAVVLLTIGGVGLAGD